MIEEEKDRLVDSLKNVPTCRLAKMIKSDICGEEWNVVFDVYMKRDDRKPISDTRRRHNRLRWKKRNTEIPESVTMSDLEGFNIHQLRNIVKPTSKNKYRKELIIRAKQLITKRNNKLRNNLLP